MHSFWQRLIPPALTAFMVILAAVPLRIPGIHEVMPAFTLINIYYWGIFYPGILPYWFLCVVGLLEDTLAGMPLGVSSFVNLAVAFMLVKERRILGKMLFGSVWFGFMMLACFAMLLQWCVISIYFGRFVPIGDNVMQCMATCLAYPLLHLMLTKIYRRIYAS